MLVITASRNVGLPLMDVTISSVFKVDIDPKSDPFAVVHLLNRLGEEGWSIIETYEEA